MTAEHEERAEELVIHLEGTFDVPAAWRVRDTIARVRPGQRVCIDLTHVRESYDFGIAVLAQALGPHDARRVRIRGLRQHQLRMLRYLGFEQAALDVARRKQVAAES
jgi:anti-anti-sigma regulatory factor